MSKVRRIDWSPSEWLSGTRGLGMDETAVYITVINIIYDRADTCPNDAAFIAAQMVRSGGHHRQSRASLVVRTTAALGRLTDLGKLHVTPDGQGLTNGRAERELNKARERMRGAARAGVASGRARRPNDYPTTTQRLANNYPSASELSRTNELSRTAVRIKQPSTIKDHDTDLTNSTEAAREPSPEPKAAQSRAPAKSESEAARETRATLAEITAAKRARFMRGKS